MLEVIDEIKILNDIKFELEGVYNKHVGWSFNSPTFFLTAYKEFQFESDKTHLFFIIMRENNKIVSYIPLYIDQKKTLRFIFDEHTDFCGVIGEKPAFNFFKDLSKVILNESKINKISLDNLLPDDSLLNYLKNFLGVGTAISCYNNHSFIHSDLKIGYYSKLKSRQRSELLRVSKINKAYGFKVFDSPNNFPFEEIVALRNKMISNGWRDKSFFNDKFIKFCHKLYDSKELVLITNWQQNKIVSIVFVFKNVEQKLYTFWLTLYDADIKYINLTTYVDFISSLEKKDEYYFSFGRGDYSFKSTFCPNVQNLYNLRYSKSKFDFLFTNYYLLKYFLKRIIKKL
ncbi:MAG: hypothetical protein Q8K04_03135 [Lutibacter sp.]|nr:hypothetical protein [Lutibacter sp.]